MAEDGRADIPARIAVEDIVSMYELLGQDTKRVHEEVYPHVEPEAIEVALACYACHQDGCDDAHALNANGLLREQAAEDDLARYFWKTGATSGSWRGTARVH